MVKHMFKRKKSAIPKGAVEPRPLADIKREAGELMGQLGNNQYQVFILNEESARLNKRLKEVNFEGSERIALDKEAAEATKEVANVQS